MTTQYLFIDGAYLDQVMLDVSKEWFDGAPVAVDYATLGRGWTKVFYYDCLPARKDSELDLEYLPRKGKKEALFEQLRSFDGWHVSEGLAKHRKRYGAQQKEVDILIAVDMLSHTHRRNMQMLAFLAGDQDFCPLVEAVVREGMYVQLWFHPSSIAKDLKDSADAYRKLNIFEIYSFLTPDFQREHSLPGRMMGSIGWAGGKITEAAMQGGKLLARLFQAGDTWVIINDRMNVAYQHEQMMHADLTYLKRAHADLWGAGEWQNV